MKALATLFFFIGIISLLSGKEMELKRERAMDSAIATNYLAYRQAVLEYVFNNTHVTGVIQTASLDVLPGWQSMRAWNAQISGDYCYIYGPVTSSEVSVIKKISNTYSIGVNNGGTFAKESAVAFPVPNFVPNGNIVTIVNVRNHSS